MLVCLSENESNTTNRHSFRFFAQDTSSQHLLKTNAAIAVVTLVLVLTLETEAKASTKARKKPATTAHAPTRWNVVEATVLTLTNLLLR